jgi:diaminopimelate decarboxylase
MDQRYIATKWHEKPENLELLERAETACYVFDPATVTATYDALKAALGTQLMVSFKANPNVDLFVRCSHAFQDGIELASQGELSLVNGRTPAPKFVNTPALDTPLLQAAASARATLVFDNPHQVELGLAALERGFTLKPVILRLNASSVLGSSSKVQADHFGMDPETLEAAARKLEGRGIKVHGIHVFAGSYTFDVAANALCNAAAEVIARVGEALGKPLEFLNLGGGFADDWDAANPKFAEYRTTLAKLPAHLTVAHEAGRAIFSRGGIFATRVLSVKSIDKRRVVVCDGGLAHCFMLAQTEKVMKRLRRPQVVAKGDGARSTVEGTVQVVGNSCNRSDVIGELTEGLMPEPGDMLVFENCGAYHSYTPKNFLELKSARHYIVS